jgi:hypothetical protein
MDYSATYCPTRRDLEERGWWLTDRLAALTTRLMQLMGEDHRMFQEVRQECRETRVAIDESHRDLREHRRGHGC